MTFIEQVFDLMSDFDMDETISVSQLFKEFIDNYPEEYDDWTMSDFKHELKTQFKYSKDNGVDLYFADYYLYNGEEAILLDIDDWTLWYADDDDLETIREVEKEESEEKECGCEHKEIEEAVNKLREILKKYGHDPNVGLCVFGFCD